MRFALAVMCSTLPCVACRSRAPYSGSISTDRPGFLFASSVVPRGATQLELGLPSVSVERARGASDVTSSTFMQGRYGWSEVLELRVAATPLALQRVRSSPDSGTEVGAGDLEIGAKLALPSELAAVLVATLRVPTGERPFTSGEPAPSLYVVCERALDECTSAKGMLGLTRTPDGDGGELDGGALALLLGRTLSPRFSGYVEAASFPAFERGPEPTYAGAGMAWLVASNVQLDLWFDAGLDDDAVDALLGLGLSLRW